MTLPPFRHQHADWVQAQLDRMSPRQRIGQLFHVGAYTNKDQRHVDEITRLLEEYNLGGLIFFQNDPEKQVVHTLDYMKRSVVPPLISIDGEWGLAMRLDDTPAFPYQMTLGAVQDLDLIYEMGKKIALHCREMGIHVNYAPVVDINTNPRNPVIGYRSFGEDVQQVIARAKAYMHGMQDHHVLACAKHFPGHGDSETDSHLTLPTIHHSAEHIEAVELEPYRQLMAEGLGSVMVAHLHVPSLDSTPALPSSLSRPIVQGLLKDKLGFQGLAFTDALDMKGAANADVPGKLDLRALLAGNDALLYPENVPAAVDEIERAVDRGEITQEEIDRKVRLLLEVKAWCGVSPEPDIRPEGVKVRLADSATAKLNQQLANASVTLTSGALNEEPPAMHLALGDEKGNFAAALREQGLEVDSHSWPKDSSEADLAQLKEQLGSGRVLISIHDLAIKPMEQFKTSQQQRQVLAGLNPEQVYLVFFGNAYALPLIEGQERCGSVLLTYQESPEMHRAAAAIVAGKLSPTGQLPVRLMAATAKPEA